MVTMILVLAAALIVLAERLSMALAGYLLFTAAVLWQALPPTSDPLAITAWCAIASLKLIVGPLALVYLVRRYALPVDLGASWTRPWRVAAVIVTVIATRLFAALPGFMTIAHVGIVLFALLASILVILLHRNLIAHVVGLLALGSSITLAGALFAPGLPEAVELSESFDALVVTIVALMIARALVAYDPGLDVRSLRELRG